MKHLLIVYHSKTGHTQQLISAALAGATDPQVSVQVRLRRAAAAHAQDLLWADGLLLGTPENFGYMSGALKDFFDRTYYEVQGQLQPLPYALIVAAGNDGSGAVREIQRIARGYPLIEAAPPVISQLGVEAGLTGNPSPEAQQRCQELGMTLAAGLEMGIF